MTKILYHRIVTFNALLTLIVLLASFYFQFVEGLIPCPLCIMQRVCVFLLLAIMGFSFNTRRKAHRINLLLIVFASAGLFFSIRQLWLQSLPPDDVPACMPGLDVLIRYFPLKTVAQTLFWGAGDCAETLWQFLGISMAGWSALYFVYMLLVSLWLFWCTRPPRRNKNNPLLS
ncbi:MAG: disulfide bond formation protein DsbB [Legionella sp. 40-6]|nr:disulfide bond formation protein B [Legionella sp.]OJY38915.1 MAG: disulfide bond formation protein DsbB [Legionella sp. 40-6]